MKETITRKRFTGGCAKPATEAAEPAVRLIVTPRAHDEMDIPGLLEFLGPLPGHEGGSK